jgi:hypothetical protein
LHFLRLVYLSLLNTNISLKMNINKVIIHAIILYTINNDKEIYISVIISSKIHNNYLIFFIENLSLSSDEKRCTRCASLRKKVDFCRLHANNPQYEYSTCNQCHIRIKNT